MGRENKMTRTGASSGKQGGFAAALDRKFHITERGSTVSQEIKAGFGAFAVAVCALLLTTQLIGKYYGNYAGSYLAITLTAMLATFGFGIIANLPVMQTASIPMATLLVTYLGANTGLTYANLVFISFISSVISLVIVVTPLRKLFLEAIPSGVRKALPMGIAIYTILQALRQTGLVTSDGTPAHVTDLEDMDVVYFWIMLAGILLFVLYMAVKRRNALGSTYFMLIIAMWVIGIVFFMDKFVGGQTATTLVYKRVNLIVATDGAAPYNLANGISSLHIGTLFSKGMNFSAFTKAGGQLPVFLIQSIATFTLTELYMSTGAVDAAGAVIASEDTDAAYMQQGTNKVLVINSIMNVIGSCLGAAPQTVSIESSMQTGDGGRTGLSSLTAGIGLVIAACNWIFFAIGATTVNGVGMWINDTETKLAAYVQDKFVFAALLLIFTGVIVVKSAAKVDTKDQGEMLPFLTCAAVFGLSGDVIAALAFGMASYLIARLLTKKRGEITVKAVILTAILIVIAFITIKYGGTYIVQQTMGAGGPPA